jgi:hypothetical protein
VIIAVVVSLVCIAAIVAVAAFVLQRKRKQHARTQVDLALCCVATRAGLWGRALVRRVVLRCNMWS